MLLTTTEGEAMDMEFLGRRRPGCLGTPNVRRRVDRILPFNERRTSKVWDHYTQLSMYRVECNHCKKQLSFHNSTSSMREHLIRKHNIRDGADPPPNTADVPNPSGTHPQIVQSTLLNSRVIIAASNPPAGVFQPVLPVIVKEEQSEELSAEATETKHVCAATYASSSTGAGGPSNVSTVSNLAVDQVYGFSSAQVNSSMGRSGDSNNNSGTGGCNDKRTGVFTDLILEMVFRDLQPLSVVEDRGFRFLVGCLEPSCPMPTPSLLGSLLCDRYQIIKQCLQHRLQIGLTPRCITLCTEHWGSVEICGVEGIGKFYLTVSAHFVDSNWHLIRCVLKTCPVPNYKENTTAKLTDTLKAVLSEFHLPENYVLCVVHDCFWGDKGKKQSDSSPDQEYQQDLPGPSQGPFQSIPEGWEPLLCAGEALKLCVQEGVNVEAVRDALSDARGIVLHFQHDAHAAAALNQKAEAANKAETRLVLDDPRRWATAIDMCESLLELKWVVSSVLEEQKTVSNLADNQWRLLRELVPVLKTVRIAASFLSEDVNAPISALMPCLQGVSRLLQQNIAECSCPVIRGIIERIRAGMEKRLKLSDEEVLLVSPAVLSSFLDPRFKEMRFLSPQARSRLHAKVKELLSVQDNKDSNQDMDQEMDRHLEVADNDAGGESTFLGSDDSLPIPTVASLDSPQSCASAEEEEGNRVNVQPKENLLGPQPPEQDNVLVASFPKAANNHKRASGPAELTPPLRGDLHPSTQVSPHSESMYDILLGEDPTEQMPEIHQQLENYIAEPLCKRTMSPLHWWRSKEHRFPGVAQLARKYLAIPATAIPAERAFAARESPVVLRRAMLDPKHLDHILFLHQNCNYVEQLKDAPSGDREIAQNSGVGGNQRQSDHSVL